MADFKVQGIEIEEEIIAPAATTTTPGLMTGTDKTKLDSVEDGATANQTDAFLLDRTNHTGTQSSSTISDFQEATQDAIGAAITAGSADGLSVTYDDPTGSISFTNLDKGSDAVAAHELASDPHPQYLTNTEGNAAYQPLDGDLTAVAALAGAGFAVRTTTNTWATRSIVAGAGIGVTNSDGVFGSPTVSNSDRGSVAVATHEGLSDPHPQYETSAEAQAKVDAHAALTNNPHAVTKAQVGLGSVDNTSDLAKPISTATQTALNLKYDASNPNGYETPTQLNARDTNNRDRTNHTGTQLAATISDFASTVRSTVLTGVSFVDSLVLATDSILVALGKLQGQISQAITNSSAALALKANLSGGNTCTGDQVINGALTINSTTKGFLPPRMTSAQRIAIASPAEGLLVFDTDLNTLCEYSGAAWKFELRLNTSAIQTSTSSTYANVTEMVTPSLESGLYVLELKGIMQSTTLTTGVGLRLFNGTAAVSTVAVNWSFSQGVNGTDKMYEYSQLNLANNIASASVITANTNFPVFGNGVFRITTAGTMAIQIRSEVNLSGVSIRPDSTVMFKKVG